MKSIIFILAFSALSAFATETFEMDDQNLDALNVIIKAIDSTKEAKLFAKYASFDEVKMTANEDQSSVVIDASGLVIVQGDIACGDLKIKIERTRIIRRMGGVTFKVTLDKSALSDYSACKIK